MTSHRYKRIDDESLSMTDEEREQALSGIHAIVESAHPPAWAGVPLPEKKSAWQRMKENLSDLFF